jgi:hypothetical protein
MSDVRSARHLQKAIYQSRELALADPTFARGSALHRCERTRLRVTGNWVAQQGG